MADEQYRWLDRDTAERLLRGEPLDAVAADAREQAERLSRALGALSAVPEDAGSELPGEAEALTAFRAARAGHVPDNGVVRIGGGDRAARHSRWGRPLRLALCAAVAAGTVGGVAVAAGTGVLPTFGAGPDPRVTVSADATAERPPVPSTPDGTLSPGATAGGDTAGDAGRSAAGRTDATDAQGSDAWRRRITEACQDLRGGHDLDGERRRALETAAGGAPRVGTYCRTVLAASGDDNGQDGSGKARGGGARGTAGTGKGTSGRNGATAGGTGKGTGNQGGKGAGGQSGGQDGDQGGGASGGKDGGQGGDDDGHGRPGDHGHGHGGGQSASGAGHGGGQGGSGHGSGHGGQGGSGAGHGHGGHGPGAHADPPHTL
ncbi:hypothetical protein C3489_13935 [Streptomyces sp. Ru71]|uniref:hypothetical protein n=1 Tax=Streptomyces sp. Ru71 TaxID=2080746 RepID=UPI000CDDC179|nr:hypothetical protein [Streptomyces sp. Ru71]POX54226.1 hypothetical protein C3489_13935 [Streptomyces sp. Ru71]